MHAAMLTRSLLSALWSSALLILILAHGSACSECEVYYIDQPINQFTCNPFLSGVKLECTIYHTNDKTYDIYWYKIPIPMGVEIADPELVNKYRLFKHTNTINNYFGGKLMKSQFDIPSSTARHTEAAGYIYWCQVVLLDESGQASSNGSFKASSAFLLRSPEWYSSFPPCSDVYQSQPNSTCARIGDSSSPPSITSNRLSTPPPNQIVTSVSNQGSVTDSNSNNLPPWGYAVIAGGGVASMIIITVILCILLAFCQTLQKYKTRPPLELEDVSTYHGSSLGQPMGGPPLPMRNLDISAARVPPYHVAMIKREPDPSDYFEMRPVSIRGMATAGPRSPIGVFQTGSHQGIIGLPQGDEWRKSSRIGHRQSSSTASSSTVEINDHIYHTIDQLEDEAYHSPTESTDDTAVIGATAQNAHPRLLLCRSSQSLRGPVVPESIAKPKTPPPRLLNSPKSTACLKTSKLPLVPSSQSVRIISSSITSQVSVSESATTTADQETTRESPPRSTDALELKQKQHQARESTETNDYVSLCSTPRTSAAMS